MFLIKKGTKLGADFIYLIKKGTKLGADFIYNFLLRQKIEFKKKLIFEFFDFLFKSSYFSMTYYVFFCFFAI